MDYIDLKKLSEMLNPPTENSSDSEDDLPKSSLVQLCKFLYYYTYLPIILIFFFITYL